MPDASVRTRLSTGTVLLFAVACGVSAANLYYAQPLLPSMAKSLHIAAASAALVVTGAQVGYGVGLALLVPLGDLLVRRRLVPTVLVVAGGALFVASAAPGATVLVVAVAVAGLCSVSAQILVPFAAELADDQTRGRVVGTVMSGLLVGILMARTFSGLIAQALGWRAVYLVAGIVVLVLAGVLSRTLPGEGSRPRLVYRELLGSVVHLMATEPLLRLRSAYGGLMFAAFNVLWTSLAFILARPPYGYQEAVIGLFGLLGAGGALGASFSGRLSDRGHERTVTAVSLVAVTASFGLLGLGAHQLWALVLGIVVADLGIQAVHIQNQQLIFAIDPAARSRLNTGYMVTYFVGGAVGSATTGIAFADGGWSAVVALGAGYSAAAVLLWAASRAFGFGDARPAPAG